MHKLIGDTWNSFRKLFLFSLGFLLPRSFSGTGYGARFGTAALSGPLGANGNALSTARGTAREWYANLITFAQAPQPARFGDTIDGGRVDQALCVESRLS